MASSEMGCVIKVNMNCETCRMLLQQMLKSISGPYSVTIDTEEGLAKIIGEVDPNILLKSISRPGKHAELKWVNLKSYGFGYGYGSHSGHGPINQSGYGSHSGYVPMTTSYYNNDNGYYDSGYGYGSHSGYGPMNNSYYRGRAFMPAEGMHWGDTVQQNYWPQGTESHHYQPQSNYSSNYGNFLPPSGTGPYY